MRVMHCTIFSIRCTRTHVHVHVHVSFRMRMRMLVRSHTPTRRIRVHGYLVCTRACMRDRGLCVKVCGGAWTGQRLQSLLNRNMLMLTD
jgi:hypothetical protein